MFFLRIPLFNPDNFLNGTIGFARCLFSRWFFIVWLALMAAGAIVLLSKRNELFSPLSDMFMARSMIIMWVILILLKMCHEFGHAYSCKIKGGHIPEMASSWWR